MRIEDRSLRRFIVNDRDLTKRVRIAHFDSKNYSFQMEVTSLQKPFCHKSIPSLNATYNLFIAEFMQIIHHSRIGH